MSVHMELYSIATDFGGVDPYPPQLKNEIAADATITTEVYSVMVNLDNVEIRFAAAISAGEKAALDAVVANHVPNFDLSRSELTYVKIVEEDPGKETGGRYRGIANTTEITVSQGSWEEWDMDFAHNISLLSVHFGVALEHEGDIIECIIAPDTVVGAITAGASIGDTVINVSPTVVENVTPGLHVKISDNMDPASATDVEPEYLEVYDVDSTAGTITLRSNQPLTKAFSPGAFVLMCIKMGSNYKIGAPGFYKLGDVSIGGSLIPKGYKIRTRYKNVNGRLNTYSAKKEFTYGMEFLY